LKTNFRDFTNFILLFGNVVFYFVAMLPDNLELNSDHMLSQVVWEFL